MEVCVKLSVIIPAYNEASTVLTLINMVKAVPIDKEIIVVDDGSVDGTTGIVNKVEGIKTIFHKRNKGKGVCIREGINAATGDIIIIQDADLEYDPNDYIKIMNKFNDFSVDIVYGARNIKGRPFSIVACIKTLNFLSNVLYGTNLTDEATCYKAFRREVVSRLNLKCKKFEFCPEFTAKVSKFGYKIYEVPVSYTPRLEGKKINWIDGMEAIWTLIRYRFKKNNNDAGG